jgi:hypothetical protein
MVKEGEYGGNIMYSLVKMKKKNEPPKSIPRKGGRREGWMQLRQIVNTFVNDTMYSQYTII